MVSFIRVAAVVATASVAHAINAQTPTNMGCYHSSQSLTYNDTYPYQTSGYCQSQCVPINKTVMATTGRTDCWCGDTMPPLSTKVDASNCNATCTGYGSEMCGSLDGTYFTVYNSGLVTKVTNYNSTGSGQDSSSTSSASASVVTVGGQTHTITAASTADASSGSSGPNKAGIAAGVVIGIAAIAAIVGAAIFYVRRKKRQEVEDEVKRQAAINSFMSAGKPRSSGGISSSDSRLDPTIMTRRQSDGSIMDNQDYSRRILKVTNA